MPSRTHKTIVKQRCTEQILSSVEDPIAYKDIWCNTRTQGGLRLTLMGFTALTEYLHLEHHVFPFKIDDFTLKTVFLLDKHLRTPYYIEHARNKTHPVNLMLFGDQEAMMLKIYGELSLFLESYEK